MKTHLGKLTAMMLKKSSSPRVSSMEDTVCLAMVSLRPFMLPLTSTRMTTSFGEVAAWMYHFLLRQSKAMTPFSSGFHLIPLRNRICVTSRRCRMCTCKKIIKYRCLGRPAARWMFIRTEQPEQIWRIYRSNSCWICLVETPPRLLLTWVLPEKAFSAAKVLPYQRRVLLKIIHKHFV